MSVPFQRPVLLAVLVASSAIALSGCSWFRREPEYLSSQEARPLEVPPDLVLPSSSAALQVPAAAAAAGEAPGTQPPSLAGPGTAFSIADSGDSAFRRVGLALERIDGVGKRAPVAALNAYEVSYEGADFLIRLSPQGDGVRIDAIDGQGVALSSAPAQKLLGALRARLQ